MLQLPSPIQKINWNFAQSHGVELWLKRDDLIHATISGNKWRKLKYNFEQIKKQNLAGMVTFGGAFSNHLVAAAFAGKSNQVPTVGIVRGEEADFKNPSLQRAIQYGMVLRPIDRIEYKQKETPAFLENLQKQFPKYLIVPEGGANVLGVLGCTEILAECNQEFDVVATAVGTATTFTGLVASANHQKVLGFLAIKGGEYLTQVVKDFLSVVEKEYPERVSPTQDWTLKTQNHCGGFAKVTPELVNFANQFFTETRVPLDPVYTAKMMFGLKNMIESGEIKSGTKILAIHTGGLQGLAGMNQKLKNKSYKFEYEKDL